MPNATNSANPNTEINLPAFEGHQVRVHRDDEGDLWFVAADVCRVLEIVNSRDAIRILDDDERGVVITDTLGGSQELSTISEPGLYKLLARSRKPEAKRFDRWVRHEVLPAIRRDGAYLAVPSNALTPNQIGGIMKAVLRKQLLETVREILPTLVTNALSADPRVAVGEYISVRELLDEAKVPSRGRRPLNARIGSALRAAIAQASEHSAKRCARTGTWLFPVGFARGFMRGAGATIVREHLDRLRGQGRLRLVAPH